MGNVFSRRVARLNTKHGKTYQEMAHACGYARSVTWWNKVRWEEIENPPEPGLFKSMSEALEVPERRVAEMVAEQWCGVRPDDTVPEHLRSLVAVLRDVREEDLPVIEQMAQALCDKRAAEDDAERFSKRVAVLEGDDDAYARDELEGLKLAELQAIAVRVGHGLAGIEGLDEAELVDLILEAGN
ncbi:hypothetical protein [Streptomyces sp. NPDC088775]|uniref:hypothetical protein n=1 Tax=Streptomyces sp. NPDC088775 TaxID=3365896 RepID=UPI0037F55758